MLTTKRYEYLPFDHIQIHDTLTNHRSLDRAKITHLEKDIVANGLLEPLVLWERDINDYYLVGGFHRMEALKAIRIANPGYFDRVDVRIVSGDPDEIKALNLKLNSDRVDTRITDFFQTVIYLNNANWSKQRIAEFFDKSVSWIEDIIRYAPLTTAEIQDKLASGELSWARAKTILQRSLQAEPGKEKQIIEQEMSKPVKRKAKPLPLQTTINRLSKKLDKNSKSRIEITHQDLYELLLTLQGKSVEQAQIDKVRKAFPMLWDQ
ncbi:MAG: ParB N-terminal domain-containing protein [Gammaproteobacteria bacterium]|nr:ParB N-terminal domain-containing protein [Gammaproteobacteria bacterium]